jgi:hypothetical protein
MRLSGQRHLPVALPPRNSPGFHCIGNWVGPRTGMDWGGKDRSQPGFDPRTVQFVASLKIDNGLIINYIY